MEHFLRLFVVLGLAGVGSPARTPFLALDSHENAKVPRLSRPDKDDYPAMARWIVGSTTWGTLSTISKGSSGTPNGGLKSHSDDVNGVPSGRVFMYLSPLDVSTQDLMVTPHSSYSVSEMQLEPQPGATCHGVDPEDPTCAKVTLIGMTLPVAEADRSMALASIFKRHPSMQDWPEGHHFTAWEFKVEEAHLLDWYGGMKIIPGDKYYGVDLQQAPTARE